MAVTDAALPTGNAPGVWVASAGRARCGLGWVACSLCICVHGRSRARWLGLHLGHGIRIHAGGRVEDDARRAGLITSLITGWFVPISIALARHFLKHAIDHANVEVNVFIEAGAKAVYEGDCADV